MDMKELVGNVEQHGRGGISTLCLGWKKMAY